MAGNQRELQLWAQCVWPAHDWVRASVVSGAFHEVLLLEPDVAARVTHGPGHRERVAREAMVMRTFSRLALPFALPGPLGQPITRDGRTGLLTTFVPGVTLTSPAWRDVRTDFAAIINGLSAVSSDVCDDLPPPRSWCGGERWFAIVRDRLSQRLSIAARAPAVSAAETVIAIEKGASPGLVHGDLGLHNVLWSTGHIRGVIDLDGACWGDPAIDVAPLVGTFGAKQVADLADAAVLDRSMYHRASLPLQVAAAAELAGNVALRDHALRNFERRLVDGTLYDPGGDKPAKV